MKKMRTEEGGRGCCCFAPLPSNWGSTTRERMWLGCASLGGTRHVSDLATIMMSSWERQGETHKPGNATLLQCLLQGVTTLLCGCSRRDREWEDGLVQQGSAALLVPPRGQRGPTSAAAHDKVEDGRDGPIRWKAGSTKMPLRWDEIMSGGTARSWPSSETILRPPVQMPWEVSHSRMNQELRLVML